MKLDYRVWDCISCPEVYLFRLTAADGSYIELTNKGATWVSAVMPDAQGRCADVLLGYSSLQGYINDTAYMGATVGRYANRIAQAQIVVDDIAYRLETNDGCNTNHGGINGWHRRIWEWCEIPNGVRFMLTSPHLEGGFPGTVRAVVDYCMDENHCVTVRHTAVTDKATHLNMTNHAYFNLSAQAQSIDDHILQIFSDTILDTTAQFIPTGQMVNVKHTPFDFMEAHPIGDHRNKRDCQLQWNRGYNHCYLLGEAGTLRRAAVLTHPSTGRQLSVATTLPAVFFYSAGYLESCNEGKHRVCHTPHTGVCLETQFYPDAPSHKHFPSTLLQPGEEYNYVTQYKFETI